MGPLLLEVILAKDSLASRTSEMAVNQFHLTRVAPTWSYLCTDPLNDHPTRIDLGILWGLPHGEKVCIWRNLLVIKSLPFLFHGIPQNSVACIVQPRLLKEVADEKLNVKNLYLG